ncbi:MAG: ABC transporter ATP-binding protein [Actinomycetota bacterium]
MTAALRVDNLAYRYPGRDQPAVDGMSFEVAGGEVFGFLGPSGAGKTTTQRAVLGLVDGWNGTIELFGRDRREWGAGLYDRIGVCFELPVGYPRLTAREDLTHFAHLHRRECRDAGEVLAGLGLDGAADQTVGSLSKGMRIRLNLARAVLHNPDLLFLDEPTAGLDPVNAAVVRELIAAEQARGCTVFVTTHDMALADAACDRVAFVVDGRICACDSPRAFRLGYGQASIRVEQNTDAGPVTTELPLEGSAGQLAALLESGSVETIHTAEASLDEVFTRVTGRDL